ncbi:excinuclease ABC subunit UvrC [Candidatus Comchoanobacter bicostacola]|uniref:Excinuclease cho n=1 Tax=Candidatus Comchoanobacter bicostacola TaxID=2919598 RepID=A0ABY5DMX1_9GAMM|nr:excinuclease ABC subunit UvrC [Candidatus Comchoanobacter bicostacola]UTC24971.1 excinuclease ABC subunit UvrC [Candidatus Comchoanobacter bicostacola]
MRFSKLIQGLDEKPGVYFMLDKQGRFIYIGKAKNLKNRLRQYFSMQAKQPKVYAMLNQVADVKVLITATESEALLLENQMIKKHQPTYNVLLKDDKSHPYLQLSQHDYPSLKMVRVKAKKITKGRLYGPYPHADQASKLLDITQRICLLRNCSDQFFSNRTRPCIQYEIKRCSAPCVGKISKKEYAQSVRKASSLMSGNGHKIRANLMEAMMAYSKQQAYERAAACRDALKLVASPDSKRATSDHRHIFVYEELGDVLHVCIAHFVGAQIEDLQHDLIEIMHKCSLEGWAQSYVCQYYALYPTYPNLVIVQDAEDATVLSSYLQDKKIKIRSVNSSDAHDLELVQQNMQAYRQNKIEGSEDWHAFWQQISGLFGRKLTKIVCFDVSHHQGASTYASCVVATHMGMDRKQYRLYKVDSGGDDYESINQAVVRWAKKQSGFDETVVVIDGGKGQMKSAMQALVVSGQPPVLTSIAKGVERKWGREKFFIEQDGAVVPFQWPPSIVRTILYIRDQAHDHAITAHRKSIRKAAFRSVLDEVYGLGPAKKKLLLAYFGGLEGVKQATLKDLRNVPQIGPELAKRIYETIRLC